jgi:uncharacterized OsmC-like protein
LPDRPAHACLDARTLGAERARAHNRRIVRAAEQMRMTLQHIAAALQRVEAVLQRRPDLATKDDAPATARWAGGLHCVSSHPNGVGIATDLPTEIGGTGEHVSPGWLMRASLASCAATSLVLSAAMDGIELTSLEVVVESRSDARGLLGMTGEEGDAIDPAPLAFDVVFRVSARGVSNERLERLVAESQRRSPVPAAIMHGVPTRVRVEIEAA